MSKRKLRFSKEDLIIRDISEGEEIECEIALFLPGEKNPKEKYRLVFRFDGIQFINASVGPLENLIDDNHDILTWDYVTK